MEEKSKKAVKICLSNRKRRVGVVCSSLQTLKEKCSEKLDVTAENFVLVDDGTEVDEEYFQTLQADTCLMALEEGQQWAAETESKKRTLDENSNFTEDANVKVMKLMETIRHRKKPAEKSLASGKQKQKLVSVNVGWMNYTYREQKYKLIKATREHPHSGPRVIKLDPTKTMSAHLDHLKEIFFPMKRSHLGHEKKFIFSVGNYKGEALDPHMSLQEYIGDSVKTSLYLQSKQESLLVINTDTSSDSDFELPCITFQRRGTHKEEEVLDTDGPSQSNDVSVKENTLPPNSLLETSSSETSNHMMASNPLDIMRPVTMTDDPLISYGSGAVTDNFMSSLSISPPKQDFLGSGTPTVEIKTDRKCIVCYDRDPFAFYVPCGHTSCLACALHLQTNGGKCPHCRQGIQKVRSIFNDFSD